MSKQVIFLKETSSYDDALKKDNKKLPLFLKKLTFLYKYTFNIVTKKKISDNEIWILPIKEKYSFPKIEKILQKELKNKENIYLLSNELKESKINLIMEEHNIEYLAEEKIKKILIFEILKYIVDLQNTEMSDLEITVLVNSTSDINMYLVEELAKQVKTLKIVSLNIYKFKNLEEKLYSEYGIPIQFSNSYRKSLEKSKLIINIDFNEFEINEYEIFDKAIIINCIKDNIKIKSRLFNGIVINSLEIKLKKEIIDSFKQMDLYCCYKNLLLYASIIEKEENIFNIHERINHDNINIVNLIGNNGLINKKEIKNIAKKLDKNKKKV